MRNEYLNENRKLLMEINKIQIKVDNFFINLDNETEKLAKYNNLKPKIYKKNYA